MPADAAAQVFVDEVEAPALGSADAHHLGEVLRLRAGEVVLAADGRGAWRRCRFTGATARGAPGAGALDPDGPVVRVSRPQPAVTVGFVPVKAARPEWVVQKLTEAGVDEVVVLRSARAVVQWEENRQVKVIGRLRRVAREAAAQSRRAWLPEVTGVLGLRELEDRVAPVSLALAHPGGDPPGLAAPAVAVGPEGGWDAGELGEGRPLVGLGPQVLRAETAAMGAGLLLCWLRARVVAEARSAAHDDSPQRAGGHGPCNHHAE